jgi:hypothetical protein
MASPIESGSRTTAGSYTLPVPSWASVVDYFLLGGGKKGTDGTYFSSGDKGEDGRAVTGSVRIRPGSSLSCSIAGPAGDTTINIGGVVYNSSTGSVKPSSNTLSNPSVIEGDPAVAPPWTVSVGTRGDGGAGGSKGDFNSDPRVEGGPGSSGIGGGLYWRFRMAAQIPRIGNIPAIDVKIGTKQVQAIYIGTKKVWEKSAN